MATQQKLRSQLEIVWWIFTLLLAIAILTPIWLNAQHFPFYLINIAFIICFVTLTRYLFLLQHTFLARKQLLKTALLFILIPMVFYLVSGLHSFQTYIDEEGWEPLLSNLSTLRMQQFANYIRSELIFFGVGSIIAAVLFLGRLILSIWRVHNTDKI